MENYKYKVLIVDDEFLARKLLSDYVSKIDSLELVGTCSNAFEAMSMLQKCNVDIMLLDIHMPDITGMELIQSMQKVPTFIFNTAYSEYALESYDLGAVDYLLKPIGFPRFFQAINKAIEKIDRNNPAGENSDQESKSEAVLEVKPTNDFLTVKADYKIYKINFSDLLFIEGQHEYVTFHTKTRRITALYSLKNLEEQLPSDKFLRIHKSYIVSFHFIEDIEGNTVNVAGNKLSIGGSYKDALLTRLNLK